MDDPGLRLCSVCTETRGVDCFSKKQWGAKAHSRKCSRCVQIPANEQPPSVKKGASGKSSTSARAAGGKKGAGVAAAAATGVVGSPGTAARLGGLHANLDPTARDALEKMLAAKGGAAAVEGEEEDEEDVEEEDDPFVCDVTGALISPDVSPYPGGLFVLSSMIKDGRYHFDDGRGPEDPSAVCMSITAYAIFETLSTEHPDTWEKVYADKSKWGLIPAGSNF